jgi:hypothetical protein
MRTRFVGLIAAAYLAFVSRGRLFDRLGNDFVMRGVTSPRCGFRTMR